MHALGRPIAERELSDEDLGIKYFFSVSQRLFEFLRKPAWSLSWRALSSPLLFEKRGGVPRVIKVHQYSDFCDVDTNSEI